MKHTPSLRSLMETNNEPERQTWQQQRDIARMLNAMFGGVVIERGGQESA